MANFQQSDLQDTIQNEIQILYSELSEVKIDNIALILSFGTLIFSGYFSDIGERFPGWIPVGLLIVIVFSINEISKSLQDFEDSQYSDKKAKLESIEAGKKRKIFVNVDFKTKFSLIRPTLISLAIIIGIYYLILVLYLLQQDLISSQIKNWMFFSVIIFIISEVFFS